MQIGFSINEILCLATVASGVCWVAWRRRLKRSPAPVRKPFWAVIGADLFVVIGLMFFCRVALADWPRVPTGSMEPTLRVGDYLLVNHLAYGPRLPFTNTAIEMGQPQRGDVVVFRFPMKVSDFYVKRLVGVPGDVVSFQDGLVTVNGERQQIDKLSDGTGSSVPLEDRGHWLMRETVQQQERVVKINPFVLGRLALNMRDADLAANCQVESANAWQCKVPAGRYLMLGDNRDASEDSRQWGFLPHEQVYGKAVRVLFNLSDMSRSWTAL